MNITELVRQVTSGGQRIYTLNDCFDLLTEIRDELRQANKLTAQQLENSLRQPQRPQGEEISEHPDPHSHPLPKLSTDNSRASEATSFPRGTLAAAIEQYLAQKQHEVSPQHLAIAKVTLAGLVPVMDAWWVDQVTRSDIMRRRQQLLDAGRSIKTVNNHLAIIGAFFAWAVDAGHRPDNPAANLKLKDRTKASRKRKAFTPEQIEHVFRELPSPWAMSPPAQARYWLPLIMLYTGARPEEVAQLRVGDVRQAQEAWVFDFATMDDGQRRKNEASRRLVPVHPRLWELGLKSLLGTLDEQLGGRKRPHAQLFPELNPGANGRLAEAPSRWFNQVWLRQVKGISDSKLVLYSIRHSVATQLKHSGVEESMIVQLLGHSNSSMTTGRYGKEYPVSLLATCLQHLDWNV